MGEMKVEENVVWGKHAGELTGYAQLGDINTKHNYSWTYVFSLQNCQPILVKIFKLSNL